MNRRHVLGLLAATPALPSLFTSAAAAGVARDHDRVLVIIRLMGGNDGLNAVVPIRDDRYYRLRPTIALEAADTLPLPGGDRGLNRHLAAYHDLMANGHAGILQGFGYPKASKSHLRATEIWETGSVDPNVPQHGWVGRWMDDACDCSHSAVAALQFGEAQGKTLDSRTGRARLVADPELLLRTRLQSSPAGTDNPALRRVLATESELHDAVVELRRARRGSGSRHAYPDTAFGRALRWTGDLIEGHSTARVYQLTLGSFESGAASFDTHVDQLPKQAELYAQLGEGLRAFTRQLARSRDLDRTLVMTFSDFGRSVAENTTRGTEHGNAGLLFYAGGRINGGLTGTPADLGKLTDGGLTYSVDFRRVYTEVLASWLGGSATALPDGVFEPAGILRRTA